MPFWTPLVQSDVIQLKTFQIDCLFHMCSLFMHYFHLELYLMVQTQCIQLDTLAMKGLIDRSKPGKNGHFFRSRFSQWIQRRQTMLFEISSWATLNFVSYSIWRPKSKMAAKKAKMTIFRVVFAVLLYFYGLLQDIMIRIGKLSHQNDYANLFDVNPRWPPLQFPVYK